MKKLLAIASGIDPRFIAAILGLALVVYGVSQIYVPAAWIVAGAVILTDSVIRDGK